MAEKAISLWVWQPQKGVWWVATLFMIGSALFALGCVLYLGGVSHAPTFDTVFFAGSIFFTVAAFCQLYQSPAGDQVAYWSAFSQFTGALLFNMNTFNAFFNLNWFAQDLLIWTPNIFGSVLFQVSGSLAILDTCKRWWCWDFESLNWWITAINFVGCAAFLISAILAFVVPSPGSDLHAVLSTVFTLIGAVCFFVGSYLMWPEMAEQDAVAAHG